ncbi:MAG: hypothetical protein K5679_03260 [Lachnospiraceae bacterium]|nr:hypothetical protein [Lachnospiraceae bacterium]
MKNGLTRLVCLIAALIVAVAVLTVSVLMVRDRRAAADVQAVNRTVEVTDDSLETTAVASVINPPAKETVKDGISKKEKTSEESSLAVKEQPEAPVEAEVSGNVVVQENMEEYYRENATVVEVIDASKAEDTPTEDEVTVLLRERGFTRFPVTYEFAEGGDYEGTTEITGDSRKTHPIYQTYFEADNGDIWTIFVINGNVMANPASYNLRSPHPVQLLISETEELTSYDNQTDRYFVTIPNDSAVIVKTVDRIDAQTINSITDEEMDNL